VPSSNAHSSSAELVLEALAAADSQRRASRASRAIWRTAPAVAAGAVCVAAASRWRSWSPLIPLAVLAGGVLASFARTWLARRQRSVSDAGAAAIDRAAGLDGELRSAWWFACRETRDAWAEYHVHRAAMRLHGADWSGLYPAAAAPRAKAATAFLAVCTVALALTLPGRATPLPAASTGAPKSSAARSGSVSSTELLLPEVQKQLEALLAAAEKGQALPGSAPATAAELRSLLNRLDQLRDAGKLNDLARAMTPAAGGANESAKDLESVADRAARAARQPAVAPEVQDALQKVSDDMADAAKAAKPPNDSAGDTASSKDSQKSTIAPGKKGGEVDEASIQSVSDAQEGGGAGIVMVGEQDDASGRAAPGLGLGGGSDKRTDGGRMAALEAALRRETVEASADQAGDNVQTEARRKTEHGTAAVGYSGSAAGTFDRSRAVAPPPVPESRRAAVQSYFIRHQ
jgi:hypothetical protein